MPCSISTSDDRKWVRHPCSVRRPVADDFAAFEFQRPIRLDAVRLDGETSVAHDEFVAKCAADRGFFKLGTRLPAIGDAARNGLDIVGAGAAAGQNKDGQDR
ncbi:hypothetical protein AT6N2_C3117 [Agrobacterium tumefaciens]|nr:hypothetical protein AT6N2_C3117 [Agrobacterium tumefaciens]